ncbi:hypothetical protein AC578_2510 [Pseudocercospora eumusae]|uniref:Uncharacterized protein n=1 Tax=Pseudocercospora eumusae TaxID=321146 RepID=A0A139GT55_9PEZI|nr:hypothetical protein AC578_2510 [Pseudocercospora eumusae]
MQQFDDFIQDQSNRIDEIVNEVYATTTIVLLDGYGGFYILTTVNTTTGKKKDKTRATRVKTTVTTARIALIKVKLRGSSR